MTDFHSDDSFGQRLPPLHIYLKRVLDKYPEGGQILKELVQNADDAKARKVVFLYDKAEHPCEKLWSDALREFQGPALLAYNDASFTKEDWKNIQHPEQSGKRKDPTKVGRFGLGFISVYHLTDMPCILSEDQIGYLDPLEQHFSYDPHTRIRYDGKRGKKWKISTQLLHHFPDQFYPFLNDLFDCSETNFQNGRFQGTIFRFPLRRCASEISQSVLDEHRVLELFESFQTDAEVSLLFLKNVESIAVYERVSSDEQPRLIFKVQIRHEDCQQVHLNTAAFLNKIPQQQDFHTLSCVHIEKELWRQAAKCISGYLTVNSLKYRNTSSALQELINDDELKFLPWMGMSFQIGSSRETEPQKGRVFCFLPLPESEQTGLPVHVHGYFGLGDNRRSIKWPDLESQHDKKALWNQLLVTEVLPEVYAKLMLGAIAKSKDPNDPMQPRDVYNGWPHVHSIKMEWREGVKKFLQLLENEAIIYANHDGGCWMKSSDVFINTTNMALLSKVLGQKNCPVAQVPNHIVESLNWADVHFQKVTPAVVRECIRGDPLQFLTRDEKLELLKYVTSEDISDLNNLHLLPMQNGEFIPFDATSHNKVFIATSENPRALIPNGDARFVARDLPGVLEKHSMVESHTQLKVLQISDVHPLLVEMLPDMWKSSPTASDVLPWTPGANHHPSAEWVTVIWDWLSKHYMALPLHTFRDIPLIPMPHSRIARLKENGMIFRKQLQHPSSVRLAEGICSFLESVGAVVIHHDLPPQVTCHPHLSGFIKTPNPKGVMTIIEKFSHRYGHVRECVVHMKPDAKDELRKLLSQPNWEFTAQQYDILTDLPLFHASNGDYVSAKSSVAAVPQNVFELPVKVLRNGQKYILLRDVSDNLVLSLSVPKRTAHELLAENILPAVADKFYSADESLEIMTWVLERPEFDDLVRAVKFIPTADGQLSSPADVYEPTYTLQVLLKGKDVFPTGVYAEVNLLKCLKRIGLKSLSDVTSDEMLDSAVEVSETQANGQADVERGSILLEHINQYPCLLHQNVSRNGVNKPLFKFLEDLDWVPCKPVPPSHYPASAGWMGNSMTLYSPTDVGLIESALLLGSVQPLIGLSNMKEDVESAFNWSKELDPNNCQKVELVVRHLKNLANTFQPTEETYAVSHTVSVVYDFLSKVSEEHLRDTFEFHMSDSQPWVWNGCGFTTPDKVALTIGTLGVSLVPFLHIVPKEMQKYGLFFSNMGVQQTFQEKELSTVLQSVQQKHQTEFVPNRDDYQTDLNLVCNILRYIVNLDKFDTRASKILVPCRVPKGENHLKMVLASECLYVDEERLAVQLFDEKSQEEFDKPVIHESISNDLAQRLGLRPLSHFIAPVDEVEYDMAGPHETTVNAIKRNLDMYKNGVDIFKELIQNADDAGATEVKFLLDWRRNEQTAYNLLSDGMKACHGPALWAYNDARFSKQDIKNICSIAEQSKKHQLEKVGRFGLGFTSVYHLTDVPSVVSGPYILICDPRTIHLGSRVKPGQPGIKLDLTNELHRRTLKSYPNQFEPYNNIFGCNLQASSTGFAHTLFRLPLRTDIEADSQQPNQLSDFVCDSKEKLDSLMKSLKKSSATLLLFTQNVIHVSIQELSEDGKMKNIMSVRMSKVIQMPRSISPVPNEVDLRTERNLLKATAACIKDSHSSVPETTMILKVSQELCASDESVGFEQEKKDWHFITSSCMTRGKILDLALSPEGRKAGVLPCGGVAAQLILDEESCLIPTPIQGSAFSYLPLSVSTGLPLHVNGNFLLQPNRRQLWSKSSSGTEEFEANWNSCLMESVLLHAFVNLLQDLQKLQEQNTINARNFQSLWPRRNSCEQDFLQLVDAYYREIGSENQAPAVIFSENQWLSVHQCFFTDWNSTDPEALRDSVKSLLAKHQNPKRWVELDKDVIRSIEQAGANRCFDNNTFNVERFLHEVFFPTLADCNHIEPNHRNKIILHVLDLRLGERKVTDYDNNMKTTKCIPASPSGDKLVTPDQLVDPCNSVGSLYSDGDCRFPHGNEYRKAARLLSLTQLGMASGDLSWEDVCERAESMLNGGQFKQRSAILLKLIDKKLQRNDEPTLEQKRRIRCAAFLPVLKRPDGYPVKWYTCDTEFLSAVQLFESRHKDILGSVQPLLDEERLGSEALSHKVKAFLGIHEKEVAVSDVIQQLTILIEEAAGVMQQTSMVTTIYKFLQDALCEVSLGFSLTFGRQHVRVREKHRAAFDKLCALKFVLCEGEFRECKQLAFSYSGHSGPYLFQVPATLTQFSSLLKVCGVRDSFEVSDYLHTLQLLKGKYKSEPLNEVNLKTAQAMMQEIVACLASSQSGTPECLPHADVFVPDACCILRTPSELTFDDMNWDGSSSEGVAYTHPAISYHVAKVFGIATQRERQLETCSSFGGFEMDFGQHEELTDRLSNILRSYPDVSDVFKELLQNADDAGCTEIHFVYDPRSHQAKKIISDSWAEVQTLPSLCVFNDRAFTEADIRGIQKVGVGGKRDDITTGKFGIGFNSVYHLTDCPSFLSNSDTLCVFDPLLKYIPGVQKISPGKRFSTGESFRQKFPDMLKGYLEDISNFTGKEGTMFRFPLRQKPSVISRNVFSPFQVHNLLDGFQQVSQEVLLFLNNVKTITISCIDKHTGILEKKYSIAAELSDGDQQLRAKLSEHLKLFNDNACETIPSMSDVYSLETRDSAGVEKSWLISQMLGFEDLTLDGTALSNAACLKKPLPRGAVAALIKASGKEKSSSEQYKAFCFLPLPIYTNLPVHVNGAFELDAARKNLQKGDAYARTWGSGEDGLIHRWNRLLVEKVIAPAYAKLILHAGRQILGETVLNKSRKDQLKLYDELFPKDLKAVQGEWSLLAKATLRYIDQKNLQVLPVVKPVAHSISWHHPNSDTSLAFFDNLDSVDDSSPVGEAATSTSRPSTVLRSILLKVDFHLLGSSQELCQAFQACDVKANFVSPEAVVRHLSSGPDSTQGLPAPLKKTVFKDVKTLLTLFKYCLDGIKDPVELNGLPFQLANDKTLGFFTTNGQDGLYVTSHLQVLPKLGNRFLHKNLVTLCTVWFEKNQTSEEAYTSGIFRKFTISELGQHLDGHLPKEWRGCDSHVKWEPNRKGHPDESWLKHLWKFICSQTSDDESQLSLEAIKNWPIFPTKSGNLVPPSLSKTVLFLHALGEIEFGPNVLASAFRKLGLPEVAWKQMCHVTETQPPPWALTQVLKAHLSLPTAHGDIVRVIELMSQQAGGVIHNLSLSECDTLLHYFQEGYDHKTLTPQSIQTIKQLPIFKLQGESKVVDIQHCKHYHTVEGNHVLMDEANIWMNHMKCVFLESRPRLNLIYEGLGISPITHAGIYLKYVLPSFSKLSQDARLKHIENIRDAVLPGASTEDQEAILQALTRTPFILDQKLTLQTADYFFDPANVVFKAMVDPGKLLPEDVTPLRNFLGRIGLHTQVTQDDFLRFSNEIAASAEHLRDEDQLQLKNLCDNSKLMKNEIDSNEDLHDEAFLKMISTIKFIPSAPIKPELLDICPACSRSHGQKPNLSPFIAYRRSMPWRYLELTWSVSMLLPRWAMPTNKEIQKDVTVHDCLGIVTDEREILKKVLSHTKLICGHMEKKNVILKEDTVSKEMRDTVKGVMNKILEFLKYNLIKYDAEIKQCLLDTPICMVDNGRVFVRANQLVFDMDDVSENKLHPYLYKAPRELGSFDSILKLLGVQKSCSFDQLAGVLSAVKGDCADESLLPREQTTVKCAVRHLFTILCEQKEKCEISVCELYLPSSDYILRSTLHLYYADVHLMEQLNQATLERDFMLPLRECDFQCKNETSLIRYLPEHLRPKFLADEMQEKLCDTTEDCRDRQNCQHFAHIQRMITSEEMTQVLLRLYQHQLKEDEPSQDDKKRIEEMQSFSNLSCKTELKLGVYNAQGKKIAEQQRSRKAFFDQSTGILYLQHICPQQKHSSQTFLQIAKSCNDLLGGLLDPEHVTFLQSALDCSTPSEMNNVLSDSNIPEYDEETLGCQFQKHSPGTIIPLDIRHFLDDDPYNHFFKEEIVGYKRNLDELPSSTGSSATMSTTEGISGSSPVETTEVIYAVIVDQDGKDQDSIDLSRQYIIDIGQQEHITVSVTTLYKFLRLKDKHGTASVEKSLPEDPQRDREQIEKEVGEVFALPKELQKTAIHRLYRKWHPDKNPNQQKRTNEAFKFLQQEISRHDTADQYSQQYSQWESEINRDREEARLYQERYNRSRRRGRTNQSRGSFVPFSFSRETPDPRSARLWFRQAKEHLKAAEQINQLQSAPIQCIAFQVHQAAEVALKAAQYSLTGHPDINSNSLSGLASAICQHRHVSSSELEGVAENLNRLDCQFDKPRYPQKWSSQTSGQVYYGFSTEESLKTCSKLLNLVQDLIGIKEF